MIAPSLAKSYYPNSKDLAVNIETLKTIQVRQMAGSRTIHEWTLVYSIHRLARDADAPYFTRLHEQAFYPPPLCARLHSSCLQGSSFPL